jgi:hypothetical protein
MDCAMWRRALPVTEDTQFILCSVAKSFTALGLAMLVDAGRLDWAKPVRDYLPEFRLDDAVAMECVTTIDLLCHHTGLPRHDWIWLPADISRAEMLSALRYLEPSQDIRWPINIAIPAMSRRASAARGRCEIGANVLGMPRSRQTSATRRGRPRPRLQRPHASLSRPDDRRENRSPACVRNRPA